MASCFGIFGAFTLLVSCVPRTDPPDVTGPEPPTDLLVAATTETPVVLEGTAVTVSAVPSGGTAPYLFRWDQNAGPVSLVLAEVREATLTTEALTMPGHYVFRITVTDSGDFHAVDYVAVDVTTTFVAEAPPLAVIGEPVELAVEVGADAEGAVFLWDVTSGTATFDDPASAQPMLTATAAETVDVLLTVTIPGEGGTPLVATRTFEIVAVEDLAPRVLIATNIGDIVIELNGELAPLHTANFLAYVDDGFYDGTLFHRLAFTENPLTGERTPFVFQGGGYEHVGDEYLLREPTRDPVMSEAGNGLTNGEVNSVAMALTGGDPNSGTTQFFFNLDTENSFLDDRGFTVFAKLVEGDLTMQLIVQVPTEESPILDGENSFPIVDLVMIRVSRQ